MKWRIKIHRETPDEEKAYLYRRCRTDFALALLDWLEEQSYPLLIKSFDEGVVNENVEDQFVDIYEWELDIMRIKIHHHTPEPFVMTTFRPDSSWHELGHGAIDEIKARIKSIFRK